MGKGRIDRSSTRGAGLIKRIAFDHRNEPGISVMDRRFNNFGVFKRECRELGPTRWGQKDRVSNTAAIIQKIVRERMKVPPREPRRTPNVTRTNILLKALKGVKRRLTGRGRARSLTSGKLCHRSKCWVQYKRATKRRNYERDWGNCKKIDP